MRVLVAEGRTYLEGWCRRAEGVRLFRLDRVLDLRILDADADVPGDAEPVDVDAGLFRPSPDDVVVVLDVSAAARWVTEYYLAESVVDLAADGWVTTGESCPRPRWSPRSARPPRRHWPTTTFTSDHSRLRRHRE